MHMKKIILLISLISLLFLSLGVNDSVHPTSSNLKLSYSFEFEPPQILSQTYQNQTFHHISISNCSLYEK